MWDLSDLDVSPMRPSSRDCEGESGELDCELKVSKCEQTVGSCGCSARRLWNS